MEHDYVLVSGFSQTPKGTPINETYKFAGAVLLIDPVTHRIVKSDFNVISKLTNEFLQELVKGHCVEESFEVLAHKLKKQVSIPSIASVLQALKSAIDRYKDRCS